jgi:hypothetical protein
VLLRIETLIEKKEKSSVKAKRAEIRNKIFASDAFKPMAKEWMEF